MENGNKIGREERKNPKRIKERVLERINPLDPISAETVNEYIGAMVL